MRLREGFVTLDDVTLHYLEWGKHDAPPLLLIHGFMDIAFAWDELAQALASDYHMVALDLRGHGDSSHCPGYSYVMYNYVRDAFALVDYLGWDRFALIGHSMGANAAAVMAGTLPARVLRLLLVEGFGIPGWKADGAPERLAQHLERRAQPVSLEVKRHARFEDLVDRLLAVNPRYRRAHAERLARHGAVQMEDGGWRWKFDPRLRIPNPMLYTEDQFHAFWSRIQAPTLQVMGRLSQWAPQVTPERWNIPGMRLAWVEGAGHMVQHDDPETFIGLARRFLAGESVGDPYP